MRAALYARYSTDKQSESSIEDQLRAAHARVERECWTVVATHADEGISGSTPVAMRKGGRALLADALAKRFDVLIVESLDRISRDIGEAESVIKRLEHRSIRILGMSDGYDTEAKGRKVLRVTRGLFNELYIDDLREKTHRGLEGRFERGLSAGGRSYGYTTESTLYGKAMVIHQDEAPIVREIFRKFAEGHSCRSIVRELNARGVPSARGSTWTVSALQGSSKMLGGMLNNPIYIGTVVWNKRKWTKDPDTGARRCIARPEAEWLTRHDPALRIVDQGLWQEVMDRVRRGPARGMTTGKGAVAKSLLSGILMCSVCRGAIVAINKERYGCGTYKDRGPTVCENKRTVLRELLDSRLISVVRDELLDPSALHELQGAVRSILAADQREASRDVDGTKKRLAQLDGEIGNLVDALATVGVSAAITTRLAAAEREKAHLRQQLTAAAPTENQVVIDDVTARYKRMMMRLKNVLEDEDRDRTRQILAEMIGTVTVVHDDSGIYAELEEPAARMLVACAGKSLGLVAGAGFEPTTFGL